MKMPVPMVEPRPIAVSELAVSTRFSGGALSSSAQMASTERTANRRRTTDMQASAGGIVIWRHSLQAPAHRFHSVSFGGPMNRDLSTPIPNSYWVQPGRLLAGEYPGSMSRADAMERVHRLLAAGITSFIDLTEQGELPEYDNLLPLAEQRVRYRRVPVLDHSVPDSAAHMTRILDLIDSELRAGQSVYLHCRAG